MANNFRSFSLYVSYNAFRRLQAQIGTEMYHFWHTCTSSTDATLNKKFRNSNIPKSFYRPHCTVPSKKRRLLSQKMPDSMRQTNAHRQKTGCSKHSVKVAENASDMSPYHTLKTFQKRKPAHLEKVHIRGDFFFQLFIAEFVPHARKAIYSIAPVIGNCPFKFINDGQF